MASMVSTTPETPCVPKIGMIDSEDFDKAVSMMRAFFTSKGFVEVHTQTRLSILAACEDPKTISTYDYAGQVWPLPQTGQMWPEYEMLTNLSVLLDTSV